MKEPQENELTDGSRPRIALFCTYEIFNGQARAAILESAAYIECRGIFSYTKLYFRARLALIPSIQITEVLTYDRFTVSPRERDLAQQDMKLVCASSIRVILDERQSESGGGEHGCVVGGCT